MKKFIVEFGSPDHCYPSKEEVFKFVQEGLFKHMMDTGKYYRSMVFVELLEDHKECLCQKK